MTENNNQNNVNNNEKPKKSIISIISWILIIGGGMVFLVPAMSYLVLMAVLFIPSRTYYYIIAIALILLLALVISKFVLRKKPETQKRVKKYIMICFSALAVFTIGQIGYDIWESNIYVAPNDVNLWDYDPTNQNNLLVELEEDPTLIITENYPRINGATALYPIYAAYVNEVYDIDFSDDYLYDDEEIFYPCVSDGSHNFIADYTTSTRAYDLLIHNDVDILFVAKPSEKQLQDAKEAGVEFDMYPIGREAFVFFVNSENPVDDLSVDEIKDIYSGEIKNWKDLGGDYKRIRAFQRPEGSGSQTALQNVMGDTPLMPAMVEDYRSGMGGIITQTAKYTNYESAIGFSFRFFATEIYPNDQIKMLSLNGVSPTEENIKNGTYPFISDIYMVKLKDNNDENVLKFMEWVQSEQGIHILEETGYVSSLK